MLQYAWFKQTDRVCKVYGATHSSPELVHIQHKGRKPGERILCVNLGGENDDPTAEWADVDENGNLWKVHPSPPRVALQEISDLIDKGKKEERERCAKVAEATYEELDKEFSPDGGCTDSALEAAKRIRAL